MLPREAHPQPTGGQGPDVLSRLRLSPGGRRLAALCAAGLSGILLSLSNPPADLGPLAFGALLPLLWALEGSRLARGAAVGLAFGLVYFGILLSWVLPFGVVAWLPLVLLQSLYFGLFGALMPSLWRADRPMWSALGVAALWTAIDWFRGTWPLGGFTWGGLGYTQHDNGFLLPLASIAGVWGVTFVVLFVNALLLLAVRAIRARPRPAAALAAVATAAVLAPGPAIAAFESLAGTAGPPRRSLEVAVVQGNVPRSLADQRYLQSEVVALNHIRVHGLLRDDPPDLAVWPENSLDEDPTRDPALGAAVGDAIASVGTPTLVGAITEAPGDRFRNQILSYSGQGRIEGRYTKNHLVPFGEYVPFRRWLGWVDELRAVPRDLTPGRGITLFEVGGGPGRGEVLVGTPICFENTFPDLFRRFVRAGADLIVLATNDSSYAQSPASREHVIMSELRAAEAERYIVQAAVSGISAVVSPEGAVLAETELFRQRILRHRIPVGTGEPSLTIYTRFGDWFPIGSGIAALAGLGLVVLRPGRRRGSGEEPDRPPARDGRERDAERVPAPIAGGADPRVLVILPTYNERDTIGEVLDGVLAAGPAVDVLVVDDASPDGTGDIVAKVAERQPRVRLLRRRGKLGLASAYVTGFRTGLAEGYDVLVEMDSDLSHRPEDLPRVLDGARRYDLTIGSRYVPGGGVTNWGKGRLALSRAGNAYARTALGLPITDVTSGFRAFRRDALAAMLDRVTNSDGYAFQIEMAYRAHRQGFTVGEVPITFREREHGKSKISRRIVVEALWLVGLWGVRDRVRQRPRARSASRS